MGQGDDDILTLQWYGKQDPQRENRVTFKENDLDIWQMPKASFRCQLSQGDRDRCDLIFKDMVKVRFLVVDLD